MGGEAGFDPFDFDVPKHKKSEKQDNDVVFPEEMIGGVDNPELQAIQAGEEELRQKAEAEISEVNEFTSVAMEKIAEDALQHKALEEINDYIKSNRESFSTPVEMFWLAMQEMKDNPALQDIYKIMEENISGPDDVDGSIFTAITRIYREHGHLLSGSAGNGYKLFNKTYGESKIDKEKSGIGDLIGKEILEEYDSAIKINNPDIKNLGGTDALSIIYINEAHKKKGANLLNVTPEQLEQSTLNNELMHQILAMEYDFYPDTPYDWSKISIPGTSLKARNSLQIHDFLSDVASVNTESSDIKRIIDIIADNYSPKTDESGELTFMPINGTENSAYHLTAGLMLENVLSLLQDKGLNEIINKSKTYGEALKNFSEALTPEDLAQIQQKMLSQGKYLLSIIKDMKKEQTPA